uniref:Pentraxin (PTX) domain-containing protein n=1 Tax=Periophthalmus magnuspinnatus TaxID=409849 RepID=A0A3B4ACA2_9GOBI
MKHSSPLPTLLGYTLLQFLLSFSFTTSSNTPEYDFTSHPRFICTPMPVDADPSCFPNAGATSGEEAKATILHLRESLVQQKEIILDQRETIRELTAKLALCEGFGHATNNDHHHALNSHHKRNSSMAYSSSLKELLQRKISALEQQLHYHTAALSDHHHGDHSRMNPDGFLISFPMRTNYMYGRMKKTLLQEIFAFTLCLWIKPGMGPGLGTPFSYSAPGQSNEIVLIEWGNNPIELLIDDKAVTLPLTLTDGRWHHVCVTWSTRDGHWEAYQDGVQRGSGVGLSSWHAIKPGGVFILGQEQDTLGGRFDATQAFVGEMSEVHLWSHVLTSSDIHSLSTCSSHLHGDVFAWTEGEVELHGGVTRHSYDTCH